MADANNSRNAPQRPALFVVATPIGNLEDITFRAVRTLKEVDAIACEDTRQTQKLLNHYGIEKRTVSYHEHNEMTRAAELIMEMEQGASIALVTDAGMPGISDPGFRLISLAIRHHIPVVPLPGPAAFLAALVASGMPTDSFRFSGFLPPKSGQRRKLLESIKDSPRTQIFYEAPHRLIESLEDIVATLGAHRHVVIAREVTKLHEEFVRGQVAEVLEMMEARDEVRGEITLLIGKADEHGAPAVEQKNVRQRMREMMKAENIDEKDAMKRVAKEMGVSKSEVYRELQKSK
jgi:16S rRNA (cytidine1402-2'-O)-methyltransferase